MEIRFVQENKTKKLKGKYHVRDILDKFDLNPETVLVARGNELLTKDQVIEEDDTIEILPVVSGG